jgi:Cu-Zn family superoxide dismutase
MMRKTSLLTIAAMVAMSPFALAAGVTVTMNQINEKEIGKALGTIKFYDGKEGLVIQTKLTGLPPGEHGLHVHEGGDCGPKEKDGKMTAGMAAGGHLDPAKTSKHEGPKGQGHLGDLPPLVVDKNGVAKEKLTAPRLKVADLAGHAVVIHEGGDNFSDQPKALGGGGGRIACGVVK